MPINHCAQCLFSQQIVILHGLKCVRWPDTFFPIVTGSHDHYVIVKKKKKTFSTIRKIIWFWLTFNKETKVNYDVTRKYRVLRLVEMVGKSHKIKVIGLYSENYYRVFRISCIKNVLDIVFKRILPQNSWF